MQNDVSLSNIVLHYFFIISINGFIRICYFLIIIR